MIEKHNLATYFYLSILRCLTFKGSAVCELL